VSHGETALEAGAAEPTPGALRRIALVVGWLCAVALAALVLHLLGIDVEGWFASLWDALTAVDPEDVLMGLGLQTLDTFLSAIAWLAILRAAYPRAGIEALPIITAYAVAVAGNDVLPASLGTLVMLVMLAAIIPGATFPRARRRPGRPQALLRRGRERSSRSCRSATPARVSRSPRRSRRPADPEGLSRACGRMGAGERRQAAPSMTTS
jgi:hypothetical protein